MTYWIVQMVVNTVNFTGREMNLKIHKNNSQQYDSQWSKQVL